MKFFMLALDDRETAMAKYFHIVGAASGAGTQHTDAQIKILLRESPALVVEHWAVIRQYQPVLKRVMADLSRELSAAEMKKVRQGIAVFCNKDNLDCPEISRFFGRRNNCLRYCPQAQSPREAPTAMLRLLA